ncbi:MAG: hypothetical protein RLZZ118_2000 [Bacteroidota bacterium]|jgi:hypothetical protein
MSIKVTINTNEHLPDGTPLVRSHTINGSVTLDGAPYPDVYIEIIEPDINDIGTGNADGRGNFSIQVHDDTLHHVWIDGQDVQLVKVLTR